MVEPSGARYHDEELLERDAAGDGRPEELEEDSRESIRSRERRGSENASRGESRRGSEEGGRRRGGGVDHAG